MKSQSRHQSRSESDDRNRENIEDDGDKISEDGKTT